MTVDTLSSFDVDNSVSRASFQRGKAYKIDWFDCLDTGYRPLLSDREILTNLEAIVKDADKTPVQEVCPRLMLC